MIWFELKKIFERKLNLAAMAAGYAVMAVCVYAFISHATFYDAKTDSYVEGIKAIRMGQESQNAMTDVVSEQYITDMLKKIQSSGLDLESDEGYSEVIRHYGDIFYFVARNYTDMKESYLNNNVLMETDLSSGAHFYEQRMKKVEDFLNDPSADFSAAEKEYWMKKAGKVKTPFRWGDITVMDIIRELVSVGFYLVFVIIICVSSVFSSENESGAASLLLTTKYGKSRLAAAKTVVSVLFSAVYLSVGILLSVGVAAVLLGVSGADLPVQLWNSVIPYQMTAAQACICTFAVILLISISITLFLLMCSAHIHSSLTALAIGMALMVAPVFLPNGKSNGIWYHISALFPVRAMNFKDVLKTFLSYPTGSHVISYPVMIVAVYVLVAVVSLLFIKRGFVKSMN